jgi:hypothetical protein
MGILLDVATLRRWGCGTEQGCDTKPSFDLATACSVLTDSGNSQHKDKGTLDSILIRD